ncbi:hypothetical protein PMO31116_02260 [Pandoraea morbifera]|uniref:Peptidase inhibitor I78 family protein n=1 Tax=Pandoraea morbifera TaxID=2508300 RepID=A0A5E4UVC4_9BURK|nr:hypothetical protein [Pandoraea morbifera]VVE03897.1 hypothetical protein PMO31116_02260 [Pandoraea morbifera]
MHTNDKPVSDNHMAALRHVARWIECAGVALCLTFSIAAFATEGNGNGVGTQGPAADAMPGNARADATQACTADRPDDRMLMGKSLAQVKSMLRGCPWRIGMQDGKPVPTTRDYRPDRRTLTIENDKVTAVQRG